jgi:hypothetical protein
MTVAEGRRHQSISVQCRIARGMLGDMERYDIVPDGPNAFAVKIVFHSGRTEYKRGFQTRAVAEVWVEADRAKAAASVTSRRPGAPRTGRT